MALETEPQGAGSRGTRADGALSPYRSPSREAASVVVRSGGPPRATLLEKRMLFRRLRIESPVECELTYNAFGLFDEVRIDGRRAIRKLPWLWLTERFDFSWPTEAEPMRVEVRITFDRFARIRKFEVWIDQECVYRES